MSGKILCVVGARPNFMKIAPILRALAPHREVLTPVLVHTGQHYDEAMNDSFFRQLEIPQPDVNLEVGSGSHAWQTAEVMKRFDAVLDTPLGRDAKLLVVVGDVNSTLACTLVASKRQLPVAHVEAGLRSFDRTMPEEINRVLTDRVSDLLFVSEPDGMKNLAAEGIEAQRCHLVGNVMIDTLHHALARAVPAAQTLAALAVEGLADGDYGVVTLHRPANVDDEAVLDGLLQALDRVSQRLPLVFPVHPRARARIEARLRGAGGRIMLSGPLSYLSMAGLIRDARLVLTDSGGLQEETTALGVPCLTLRDNTERPYTVEQGSNQVVGRDPQRIVTAAMTELDRGVERATPPPLWDGRAAQRIVELLTAHLAGGGRPA